MQLHEDAQQWPLPSVGGVPCSRYGIKVCKQPRRSSRSQRLVQEGELPLSQGHHPVDMGSLSVQIVGDGDLVGGLREGDLNVPEVLDIDAWRPYVSGLHIPDAAQTGDHLAHEPTGSDQVVEEAGLKPSTSPKHRVVAAHDSSVGADARTALKRAHPVDDHVARFNALVVHEVVGASLAVGHVGSGNNPTMDRHRQKGIVGFRCAHPAVDLVEHEPKAHLAPPLSCLVARDHAVTSHASRPATRGPRPAGSSDHRNGETLVIEQHRLGGTGLAGHQAHSRTCRDHARFSPVVVTGL